MKVQHIQTLVAIADAGSLRGAAETLGKSQPALTKALRQAEDDLGVPIFHRSSRGVRLTELGERVIGRARSISSEITRLDEEVAQLRGEQTGSIQVCISPLAAVKILPQALARFHASFPNIDVHLTSGLFPGALKPLRDGQLDFVVGPRPPPAMTRDFKIEPLIKTPIVLITSRSSPFASATSLADLVDAPFIMIGGPGGPGDNFREPFIERNLPPPRAMTTSESYFGAISLVENSGAVCTFPLHLLEDVRQGWDVDKIPIKEALEAREVSMLSRSSHPLTPMAEELANCVRRRAVYLRKHYHQKLS